MRFKYKAALFFFFNFPMSLIDLRVICFVVCLFAKGFPPPSPAVSCYFVMDVLESWTGCKSAYF